MSHALRINLQRFGRLRSDASWGNRHNFALQTEIGGTVGFVERQAYDKRKWLREQLRKDCLKNCLRALLQHNTLTRYDPHATVAFTRLGFYLTRLNNDCIRASISAAR